jgi:hypothetical protein
MMRRKATHNLQVLHNFRGIDFINYNAQIAFRRA